MEENSKAILDLLLNKSALKQDIADDSLKVFKMLRKEIDEEINTLKQSVKDSRVRLNVIDKSEYEFHVYIGSDVLVFQNHTNVFRLPDEHPLWETEYLQQDESRGFFGIIQIYNFLAESFIQNRLNDAGYLIGRIFVNHEEHLMVEGRGQLSFLFKDPSTGLVNSDTLRHIVQVSFAYALEFDLFAPPYQVVAQVSVGQMQAIGNTLQISTGKRLGFKLPGEE